jgi:hypothetical protein
VKLLVSTPLNVLGFDAENRRLEVLTTDAGEYYGISWDPTGTRLALSHSGTDNTALVDLAGYAQSERGYVSVAGEPSSLPLSAPHQILWIEDEWVVATNTGRNAIVKISAADKSSRQFRYDEPLWDRLTPHGTEGSHYNSLFCRDGLLYVVAHNFDKESYILSLDWPSMREVERMSVPASGIHNLWIDPAGRWITCDSDNGALIDARTGTCLWSNGKQGYLRGLAAADNLVLTGLTLSCPRDGRLLSETGLWVIDSDTWQTRDYFDLGRFGAVHEIRIIDRPDLCHNGVPLSDGALRWMRAGRSDAEAKRLARSREPESRSRIWTAHAGPADCLDAPLIQPSAGEFLLAVLRRAGIRSLTAELHLNRCWRRGDYAGLIAAFRGPGDTNMIAALFQRTVTGELTVSLWQERGGWQMVAEKTLPDDTWLPDGGHRTDSLSFPVVLAMHDGTATVEVNGFAALSLPDIPALRAGSDDAGGGQWGIRMFGQSFSLANLTPAPLL